MFKKSMFVPLSLAFLICFLLNFAKADSVDFRDNEAKINVFDDRGKIIKVAVLTKEPNHFSPYKSGFRWGTESKPKNIVVSMKISVGEQDVFVPLSAISDLTNPTTLSLDVVTNGFHLSINGGSASTAYHAELIFEDGYIKKRKVTHREFPDVSWEETVYSFNTLNN